MVGLLEAVAEVITCIWVGALGLERAVKAVVEAVAPQVLLMANPVQSTQAVVVEEEVVTLPVLTVQEAVVDQVL
jgi:hypothetical protein